MAFINHSQWRPNMPPVSISSKPEAHPCLLQHKPYTRPLTPGATTRYWKGKHAGEKTDSLQSPASLCLWRREAAQACSSTPEAGQLGTALDWKLLADLGQRLCFSSEIATTNFRPNSLCTVYIMDLIVPWEEAVGEAFERKTLKYIEPAADAEQHG